MMAEGNVLVALERAAIVAALRRAHGRQADAAALLGISARVINYKIHKLAIDWDDLDGPDSPEAIRALDPDFVNILRSYIKTIIERQRLKRRRQ